MRGNRGLTPIIENDDGIIILSSVGAGWIFISSLIIVLYGARPSKDSYAAPAPIKVCSSIQIKHRILNFVIFLEIEKIKQK